MIKKERQFESVYFTFDPFQSPYESFDFWMEKCRKAPYVSQALLAQTWDVFGIANNQMTKKKNDESYIFI